MAPMTGSIPNAYKQEAVVFLQGLKICFLPGLPINGVVRMLQQVRAVFEAEYITACHFYPFMAETLLISPGIISLSIFSMPFLSVNVEEGQPLQAPWRTTSTTLEDASY